MQIPMLDIVPASRDTPRKSGSHETPRWSKGDSNSRSQPHTGTFKSACPLCRSPEAATFVIGDWEFESTSLQRRVRKPSVPRERSGSLQSAALIHTKGSNACGGRRNALPLNFARQGGMQPFLSSKVSPHRMKNGRCVSAAALCAKARHAALIAVGARSHGGRSH